MSGNGSADDGIFGLLVGHKDLERGYDLGEGDRLVAEPLLVVFSTVEEDEEVFVLALVVDLSLNRLSASHCDGCDWGTGLGLR